VPKLWNETIESHRREVRDAIVDTTVSLVDEYGLLSVTMSRIAEETGIGRATLYKYFPDVESVLKSWHERQITTHLEALHEAREQARSPRDQLAAVLETYALIAHESRGHQDSELAALLHRDEQVDRAEDHLRALVRDLLKEAVTEGDVRDDVAADELATYCLHSLTAASRMSTKAAVKRLVEVTLDGLRAT